MDLHLKQFIVSVSKIIYTYKQFIVSVLKIILYPNSQWCYLVTCVRSFYIFEYVAPLRFSSFPHIYLFTLLQLPSPIIVAASRTFADARLIFSEKRHGLAPFAWLLLSHEFIITVQLFSSLHSAVQRYRRDHQIFTKCVGRRRVDRPMARLFEHFPSV